MRFAFIAAHRGVWQTRQMCEALEVSRAGFYEWMKRPQSDQTYGSPPVSRDMTAWGHECGENRVARLMRAAGIVAPNLLDRQFEASAPMGCFDNTSPRAQT